MSSKDEWAVILGISDSDWERTRNSFRQIADSVINIRERFEGIALKVSEFIEQHRSGIEKVLALLQDKTFIEKMFSEYLTDTHKKLIQKGYFVGLAGWGFGYTNELKKLLDEDRKAEIEEYLLSLLRDNRNMKYIAQKWDRNRYFKNRSRFLHRGLKAHLEGDYIVSIPVLLPHIEAILAEFFVDTGLLSEVPDKFQGNTALNILKTVSVDEICTKLDKTYFCRFLNRKGIYGFAV